MIGSKLIASSRTSDTPMLCQFGIYCFVGFKESTGYSPQNFQMHILVILLENFVLNSYIVT